MVDTSMYDLGELYFTIAACGVAFIWLMIGLVMAFTSFSNGTKNPRGVLKWLITGMVLTGIVSLALGYKVVSPLLAAAKVSKSEVKAKLPNLDYQRFHSFAVQQGGREKPFESAADEIMREITGRTKFEGNDPVAVVLAWMLTHGAGAGGEYTNWESYPFILCDHHELRKLIFTDKLGKDAKLNGEQLHGKYMSPEDLRSSASLRELLMEVEDLHNKWNEKAQQHMSPLQRKAQEVWGKLRTFEKVSQNRLAAPLAEIVTPQWAEAATLALSPAVGMEAILKGHPTIGELIGQTQGTKPLVSLLKEDPIHVVGLDKVPRSAWFSIGEIQANLQDPGQWSEMLRERLSRTPQVYISPERQHALAEFQKQVMNGTPEEIEALFLKEAGEKTRSFRARYQGRDWVDAREVAADPVFTSIPPEALQRIAVRREAVSQQGDKGFYTPLLANLLEEELDTCDQRLMTQIRNAQAGGYHRDDPKWRMLHLNYLEGRFPEVYRELIKWQPFPAERAQEVLTSYSRLQHAYSSGSAATFDDAATEYLDTLRRVSDLTTAGGLAAKIGKNGEVQSAYNKMFATASAKDQDQFAEATKTFFQASAQAGEKVEPYPGVTTIDLELTFNRVQPFMYAWILMLGALTFFVISMMWNSKLPYTMAFILYLASLGFQVFGYYCRVYISGRPPVSNMYETVIWVSSMSAIFALVLELVYRRRVIGLAGALVATMGLVLADQMPLVLDPKISPLTPVLRSNFWLIIHVLTIVSSYAGGTLAWGLGNVALVMITFGNPSRDTLKTLSNYTYRAMQIAVLLLAAGTFLGGWWAAYSWGRFWGWDPKEVWALIALVCYVIPLHMRYIGWVKDFGLAVSAVLCYASIVMAWYGVNFVLGAGLHSYGFGGGGPWWVFLAGLLNLMWVLFACVLHTWRQLPTTAQKATQASEALAAGV